MDRAREVYKVSVFSILLNVALSLLKAVCGVLFNSYALVSDAVHSLSDVFSTFVVMIGTHFANKEIDEDHNYGHQKFESVAGLVLSILLSVTAFMILESGIKRIIDIYNGQTFEAPNKYAVVVALISIVAKEFMYRHTVNVANRINSPSLKADAWHHRSDAFSSIGSLVAIIGSLMGFPICDPLASVIISLLIFKVAFDIGKESIDQVTDKAAEPSVILQIENEIAKEEAVITISSLKTRIHANKIYVDASITVDKDLTVFEGHEIAEKVHDRIEENIEDVLHVTIHVEPYIS